MQGVTGGRKGKKRRKLNPSSYGKLKKRFRSNLFNRNYGGGRGMELKFHDLDVDDVLIAANGNIAEDSVLTIAQGTTESTRLGRKITIKNVFWRFKMTLQAIDAGTPQFAETVRVILYLDKQCNGATAVVATDAGILASDNFQSFNNLSNKSRFKILMDREYNLNPQAGGGTDTGQFGLADTLFHKCSIPVEYDSSVTTGAITSMRSNNIGVLLLSDQGNVVAFESKMRVRFTDA